MTTANKITLSRIAMVPVFIIAVNLKWEYSNILALAIFIIASVTDGVDGYIARKYNQVTNFGKFIDPIADKLLVVSAIILFVERGQIPSWVAIIIVAREFLVSALRLIAVENGVVIAAAISGKIKTVVSIIAICIMLTSLKDIVVIPDFINVNGVAVGAMLLATVWSGVEYFARNIKVLDVENM